jgi:hypothetical protein
LNNFKILGVVAAITATFLSIKADDRRKDYEPEPRSLAYTSIAANPASCKEHNFQSALWLLRQLLVDYDANKWLLKGGLGKLNPTGGFQTCLKIMSREGLKDKPTGVRERGQMAAQYFNLNKQLAPRGEYPFIGKMIAELVKFVLVGAPSSKLDSDLIRFGDKDITIRQAKTFLMAILDPITGRIVSNPDYLEFIYKKFMGKPQEFTQSFNKKSTEVIAQCDLNNLPKCMKSADQKCKVKTKNDKSFSAYVYDIRGNTRLIKKLDGYVRKGQGFAVHPDKLHGEFSRYGDVFCVSKVTKVFYEDGIPFVIIR